MIASTLLAAALPALAAAVTLLQDPIGAVPPVTQGQALDVVHLYYDGYPTAIAVSNTGRMFCMLSSSPSIMQDTDPALATYPPPYQSSPLNYTVGELTSNQTEVAYPNAAYNIPPGGRINYTTTPPTGANTPDYLVSVQACYIDSVDRLWLVDTGRPILPDGTMVSSAPGGPKIVAINITTNEVIQTIVFGANISYPDSYPNDIRIDLRPGITASGKGVAYLTDSSTSGRNGIIVVDLGTGEQWRHLENTPFVRAELGFLPVMWGQYIYYDTGSAPISYQTSGSDGIQLSADGSTLYFGPLASRTLYSVPTVNLRKRGNFSELLCQGSVSQHGQKGFSDGMEGDSNGLIYSGNLEASAIQVFDPSTGLFRILTRDPRISWVDTLSVATDGYLYFTSNQMNLLSSMQGGSARTVKPYVLFRTALVNNATKITLA